MVVFNYSGAEINSKVVYYGPALSGKTTNLQYIYDQMPSNVKGKMVSMKTRTDRTLFFDFLPLELGEINGYRTRILLYTVPGQVYYNATRKLVLKGADAVVFVADSSPRKLDENIESLRNLEDNLNEHGLTLDTIPWVIQYNKRDLSDALPAAMLDQKLNLLQVPSFEATAIGGEGVYETFQSIAQLLYRQLARRLEQAAPAPPVSESDVAAPRPAHEDMIPDAPSRALPSELHGADNAPGSVAQGAGGPDQQKNSGRDPSKTVTDVLDVALREVDAGEGASTDKSSSPSTSSNADQDDFTFAPIEDEKQDADVGRVIDFDDAPPSRSENEEDEFVRDPFESAKPSKPATPATNVSRGTPAPRPSREAPPLPARPPDPPLPAGPSALNVELTGGGTALDTKPSKPDAGLDAELPKAPRSSTAGATSANAPSSRPLPAGPAPRVRTEPIVIRVPVNVSRAELGQPIPVRVELDIHIEDDN